MIKNILLISAFIILAVLPAFSQQHTLKGVVVDENNGEGVPFAQVALFKEGKDQPQTGIATDASGKFQLKVKEGSYDLLVTYIGYEDKTIPSLRIKGDKNFGTITISEATKVMEEVVVKSTEIPQPVQTTMEGMEIRPDQTIANVGGTLLDVLRNTPSVRVSDDGSVSLRGSSSTNVLLDGRNSAMTVDLEQIPASAIKKIQIINNPNAKYDASAAGGVINIQLRQGQDLGTTGKAEVTIGKRWRTNANLNISHKTNQLAVYGGYSFRKWPRVGRSTTERTTYSTNEYLSQNNNDERKDLEHTLNAGIDYYVGKSKISYEGAFNKENEDDFERTRTTLENLNNGNTIRAYTRDNNEIENNHTFDNALIYERFFDDENRSFRALISHSLRDQTENQFIDVFYGTTTPSTSEPSGLERSTNDEMRNTSIFQADYSQPFIGGKLEAGLKSTWRIFDNDYVYEINDGQVWVNQENTSNRFKYEDKIHAAYAIYSSKVGAWTYAVGTRVEATDVDTRLYDTNEENQQDYINLFPSVQTSYALDDHHTLKATYSRRIDRPSAWRLNPFPDISDSLNVRVGDPNLQPEYINSFELGHMFSKGGFNLTTNAFYRVVDGQVDWIVEVRDGISYRGPRNLNTSQTYGFELINATEIADWWNINASFSFFEVRVDGTNLDDGYVNKGLSWYAKMTSDFTLPAQFKLQLTGNYESPEIEAQGRDLARYHMDASVQRNFDQWNVSLTLRDVFNTRRFAGENFGADFAQKFERNRESQILLATIGYKFN